MIDLFDIHEATVVWDGQHRTVEAESVNTDVLVRMALIHDSIYTCTQCVKNVQAESMALDYA